MISKETTVGLYAGSVAYDLADAAVSIDELIEALVEARADGATHITGLSGNYRGGARYVRLHADLLWDGDEL